MPDLVGLYWTQNELVLRSNGWTGVLNLHPSVLAVTEEDFNRTMKQHPPAGRRVAYNVEIQLHFAS